MVKGGGLVLSRSGVRIGLGGLLRLQLRKGFAEEGEYLIELVSQLEQLGVIGVIFEPCLDGIKLDNRESVQKWRQFGEGGRGWKMPVLRIG